MAKHSFLFITLIDPLHNGAGQGLGLIDRPIIRERTTGFPIIQPSSIKGVLRDFYDEKWTDKNQVKALFGPEPGKGEEHSGAISFGEGQLFAFPIRSLRGGFVWATSPLVLSRFKEKSVVAGVSWTNLDDQLLKEIIEAGKPMICEGSENKLLIDPQPGAGTPDGRSLMLEEYSYEVISSEKLKKFADEVADKIFTPDSFLNTEFKKKLIVLPEDIFRYFVTNATEVVPNIRIGDEGVTEDGSLRYTEYLPRESILYSLTIHEKTRDRDLKWDDSKVKEAFDGGLPTRIQIGGDETTGKGLVSLIRVA